MSAEGVEAIRKKFLNSSTSCKSISEALKLKKQGNSYFRKQDKAEIQKALEFYTKALFLAPWPNAERQKVADEQLQMLEPCRKDVAQPLYSTVIPTSQEDSAVLAMCFGNRSAVLYELGGRNEECLRDIKRALSLGFPEASEYKLHRRRACCLAQTGLKKEAYNALEFAEQMVKRSSIPISKQEQLLRDHHSFQTKVQDILKSKTSRVQNVGTVGKAGTLNSEVLCNAYDSKYIQVESSTEKGRFCKATELIIPGQVIMSEKPFAAVLKADFLHTHCSYCFTESIILIPCCFCSSEGYCSPECREEAWTKYHWLECLVADVWSKFDWLLRLCLRIVLSAPSTEVQAYMSDPCCGGLRDKEGTYSTIYSLVAHEGKFNSDSEVTLFERMADVLTQCFGDPILKYLQASRDATKASSPEALPEKQDVTKDVTTPTPMSKTRQKEHLSSVLTCNHLRELFIHHLLQLRCNTHSISTVIPDTNTSGEEGGPVQTVSEVPLGYALYPTISLMNHSCYPNVFFRFAGSRITVSATREIPAGEEINSCYGPQLGRMKRTERQALLKAKYFFECHCPACDRANPELQYREAVVDALACPQCKGALQKEHGGDYKCLECEDSPPEEWLKQALKVNEKVHVMFQAALQDMSINLPQLLECHKLQSEVFHTHNMELSRTSDAIAQAYAIQGDLHLACHYSEMSCQAVEVVYGNNSIELATELHKLAQLLFSSHRYDKALQIARRALDVFSLYYPSTHPDYVELGEMIRMLS